MMKVVGEEGTGLCEYVDYLKGEFLDFVYLQQNAFDPVDEATAKERQVYIFNFIYHYVLCAEFSFDNKEAALHFFQKLRQLFKGWNSAQWNSTEFKKIGQEISLLLEEKVTGKKEEEINA
jgi:V/A-type H+-transporting ATPase subunit A